MKTKPKQGLVAKLADFDKTLRSADLLLTLILPYVHVALSTGINTQSRESTLSKYFGSSEKGSFLKGNNFFPEKQFFFPFKIDPSSEGTWCTGKPTESWLPCKCSNLPSIPFKECKPVYEQIRARCV